MLISTLFKQIHIYLLEVGVLKENPPVGFWPKGFPPKPRDAVVVVEAGVAAAVPRTVPKEKPLVLAAGALQTEVITESDVKHTERNQQEKQISNIITYINRFN